MPTPYELIFKDRNQVKRTISGELSDDEHKILIYYLEKHEKLVNSKPIREGFPCNANISWEQNKPIVVKASLPDEDTLSILLHRLRPFILQDEFASYSKVCAIIGRHLSDPYFRQFLHEQHRLYDGRNAQKQMKISSNDVIINSDKFLFNWLNSHEYHQDPDKREVVEKLLKSIPEDFMRTLMVSMLIDKTRAISNIATLVIVLIGKESKASFQINDTSKINHS